LPDRFNQIEKTIKREKNIKNKSHENILPGHIRGNRNCNTQKKKDSQGITLVVARKQIFLQTFIFCDFLIRSDIEYEILLRRFTRNNM
jgi:hypothetical protein